MNFSHEWNVWYIDEFPKYFFQFDLVCDKDIYPTLGLVALNFGGPIGVYVFGMLNDRIGRKKSFFSCLTTLICGSLLTAFSENFIMWIFSRLIVGLTIPAIYQIPFIICKYEYLAEIIFECVCVDCLHIMF